MRHLLLLACLLPPMLSAADPSKEDARLTWTLHRAFAGKAGNSFLSPHSLASCLGMVSQGARGETLAEFRAVLRHRLPPETQHADFGAASRALMSSAEKDGQRLVIANALCRVSGSLSDAYQSAIVRDYSARVFDGDLGAVNAWVNERTAGMIPSILDELPANTVFVALNAVYFKGKWETPFPSGRTRTETFRLSDGSEKRVPLMCRTDELGSAKDDHFWRLRLPYGTGKVVMEVLLPAEGTALADAEREMSADEFADLLAQPLTWGRTEVHLPRFRLSAQYDAKPALQGLGLRQAFDGNQADFSGIGGAKGDLWLAKVVHKAVVQVDETGTEAAAASAVAGVTRAMPERPVVFRADRPFLFVIRSDQAVLFIGRVENPGN